MASILCRPQCVNGCSMLSVSRNITTVKSEWWLLMADVYFAPGLLHPSWWRGPVYNRSVQRNDITHAYADLVCFMLLLVLHAVLYLAIHEGIWAVKQTKRCLLSLPHSLKCNPSVRFTNSARIQNFEFWTLCVLWTKYELMAHIAVFKNNGAGVFQWRIHFLPGVIEINALSETNLFSLCLGNIQCRYSVEYDLKLPSLQSHVDIWNFMKKFLHYLWSPITRFYKFREIYI